VVVDLHEFRVFRNARREVRTVGAHAVSREDHVVSCEIFAIGEFHALAQIETPFGRLEHFPALSEARLDRQVLAAFRQAFIDIPEMRVGCRFVQRIRVERFEIALVGIAEGLGRGYADRQRKRCSGTGGKKA